VLWICLLLHFVHIHAVVYVDGIENPNNEERDSGWRRKTAVMGRPRPYRLQRLFASAPARGNWYYNVYVSRVSQKRLLERVA